MIDVNILSNDKFILILIIVIAIIVWLLYSYLKKSLEELVLFKLLWQVASIVYSFKIFCLVLINYDRINTGLEVIDLQPISMAIPCIFVLIVNLKSILFIFIEEKIELFDRTTIKQFKETCCNNSEGYQPVLIRLMKRYIQENANCSTR